VGFSEAYDIPTTLIPLSFKSFVFGARKVMSFGNLQRKVFVAATLYSSLNLQSLRYIVEPEM